MEHLLYQRPREKLRARGIAALSTVELIQLLIGSGTHTVSAARIAKNVAPLLQTNTPSYDELIKIPGLGEAKVAQLIAAFEIGARVKRDNQHVATETVSFTGCASSSKIVLEYAAESGNGQILSHKICAIPNQIAASTAIKRMVADALATGAASLVVGIGCRGFKIHTVDNEMLRMLKLIFDTAILLEINLPYVSLVNEQSQYVFKRKELR